MSLEGWRTVRLVLAGAVAVAILVLFPPLIYLVLWLLAISGLRARSRSTRRNAAGAIAALLCVTLWGLASFLWFAILLGASDSGRGAPDPSEFTPVIALALAGPVAALVVGRLLWPGAEPREPPGPGG